MAKRHSEGRGRRMRVSEVESAISRTMSAISGLGLIVLLFITVSDVVGRYFFNFSIPGAVEIVEVALVVVVFAAMGPAEFAKVHIRTQIVTGRVPRHVANVMRLIGMLGAISLVLWATLLTWSAGLRSLSVGELRFGLARIPVWPARVSIPFGLAILAVALGMTLLYHFIGGGERRNLQGLGARAKLEANQAQALSDGEQPPS